MSVCIQIPMMLTEKHVHACVQVGRVFAIHSLRNGRPQASVDASEMCCIAVAPEGSLDAVSAMSPNCARLIWLPPEKVARGERNGTCFMVCPFE